MTKNDTKAIVTNSYAKAVAAKKRASKKLAEAESDIRRAKRAMTDLSMDVPNLEDSELIE